MTVDPADVANGSFASAGGLVGGAANVKISRSANTGAVSNAKSRPSYYGTDGNYTGGLVGQIDERRARREDRDHRLRQHRQRSLAAATSAAWQARSTIKNGSVLIESCRNLGNVPPPIPQTCRTPAASSAAAAPRSTTATAPVPSPARPPPPAPPRRDRRLSPPRELRHQSLLRRQRRRRRRRSG